MFLIFKLYVLDRINHSYTNLRIPGRQKKKKCASLLSSSTSYEFDRHRELLGSKCLNKKGNWNANPQLNIAINLFLTCPGFLHVKEKAA